MRKLYREVRYPARISVPVTDSAREEIVETALSLELSASQLLRECIRRGLPLVVRSHRRHSGDELQEPDTTEATNNGGSSH